MARVPRIARTYLQVLKKVLKYQRYGETQKEKEPRRKRTARKNESPENHHPVAEHHLHPDTKKSVWAVSFLGAAVILAFAGFSKAGPAGNTIYKDSTISLAGDILSCR